MKRCSAPIVIKEMQPRTVFFLNLSGWQNKWFYTAVSNVRKDSDVLLADV